MWVKEKVNLILALCVDVDFFFSSLFKVLGCKAHNLCKFKRT